AIVADADASLNWLATAHPDLDRVRGALDSIAKDGYRAGEVIQRIRQLATKTEPQKASVDVNGVIRDVIPLLRNEVLSHHVSLRLDLAPALRPVLADRVQLQQVIINLVMNGIESMASVDDRPRELLVCSRGHEGDQVMVTVQDAGIGIDPNTVDQLFSAFFTTKPGGDLLVEKTGADARQHVSLTGRERHVATTQLGALAALRAYRAIALDRVSYGVEQILLAERLRQKLHGAGFHGPDGHGDVAV